MRGLVPVEPELSEIIVHIGYGAGFGLLTFALSRPLFELDGFLLCIELFRYTVGPLERHVGRVRPIPLQIRLAVGRTWRLIGLRRGLSLCSSRRRLTGNRECCQQDDAQNTY